MANSNLNGNSYRPATCYGVIVVAAKDCNGNKTLYSDFGTVVKVSVVGGAFTPNSPSPAPQNGIYSTFNQPLSTPLSGLL